MQNLARSPFYFDAEYNLVEEKTDKGIDMRSKFIAEDGYVFIAPDLSQVEPRCGFPGLLVKTNNGYKCIEDLKCIDKVWDGSGYVSHDGIISKQTLDRGITIEQSKLTHDHNIFISDTRQVQAGEIDIEATSSARDFRADDWSDVWQLVVSLGGRAGRLAKLYLFMPLRMWARASRAGTRSEGGAEPKMHQMHRQDEGGVSVKKRVRRTVT